MSVVLCISKLVLIYLNLFSIDFFKHLLNYKENVLKPKNINQIKSIKINKKLFKKRSSFRVSKACGYNLTLLICHFFNHAINFFWCFIYIEFINTSIIVHIN